MFNADDLYSRKDIQALAKQPSILVKEVTDVRSYAEIVLDNGIPAKIVENLWTLPVTLNIGAYHFPLRAVEFIERVPLSIRGEYEITDVVQMCFDRQLLGYTLATFWQPVGTPDQLFEAHDMLGCLPYIDPTSTVKSYNKKVIVYKNCVVHTHIENCIAAPDSILEQEHLHSDTVIYKNDE